MKRRCAWAIGDPLYMRYHDEEWGMPLHDDRRLLEFLILDGAQAGLSWLLILKKRESYRKALADFDARALARYGSKELNALLANPGIVRNRLKLEAAISNARSFLDVQQECGSFDRYVWSFVGGSPKQNCWSCLEEIPAHTPEAQAFSSDLRRRGFRFVGPTICYAFMQAVGMVNDHVVDCFRHSELRA